MKYDNIGGFASINAFVDSKLKKLENSDRDFRSLYKLMFSERDNVMFEESDGLNVKKTTYGQAKDKAEKTAAALSRALVSADVNSAVGLYADNGPDFIVLMWAILRAGFRPLLLNARLDDQTLLSALEEASAVAVVSDGREFPIKTLKSGDLFSFDGEAEDYCFGEEILVMSSGTSTKVKVCAYTAEQFYFLIKGSADIIKKCKAIKAHCDGELKLLALLPFYHVFGLIAVYVWFAFFSRTFVKLRDLDPKTVVNTIKRHKVTHVFAVPMFWEKVYDKAIKTVKERGEKTYKKFCKGLKISARLSGVPVLGKAFKKAAFREVRKNLFGDSVRFMITGGSMIKRPVLEFFNDIGYRLADGYGMSEIGITSVELSGKRKFLCGASVGKPFNGIEYKISGDGELSVRGGAVSAYVVTGGEKTVYDGGWFDTCDLARKEKGRYYVLGRKDDLVVSSSGENLNPNLIERKFDVEGVRDVCLTTDGNGVPVLVVSVNKYVAEKTAADIYDRLRSKTAELGLTSQIGKIFMTGESLIGDGEFKLNRRRIAEDLARGGITELCPVREGLGEESPLADKVRQIFADALGKEPSEVGYKTNFFLDEGGTSFDYFAMVSSLRDEFDVPFPSDANGGMNTVESVCKYVERLL